jgi:hypothetical protein
VAVAAVNDKGVRAPNPNAEAVCGARGGRNEGVDAAAAPAAAAEAVDGRG